jgi:probable HAF family extracellular repeat protein
MFSVKKLSIATVGTVAVSIGSVAPVTAASLYDITGLSFLPLDINDSAQVVGEQYLWDAGNVTDLTTLPGANNSSVYATSINNNGAIVGGGLTTNNSIYQAFISNGITVSALPPTYNCTAQCDYILAEDINDSGTVVLNNGRDGLVQQSNGTTTPIFSTRVLLNISINNNNQVVGSAIFSGGSVTGLFSDNGSQPIRLIAEAEPDSSYRLARSTANDINDAGSIVGSGSVSTSLTDSAIEATLWTDPTQPGVSLGTLGGESSDALGINDSQQIVGYSTLADGSTQHAFLWEDDQLIDLNSLVDPESGWELTSAFEINNSGDIIGVGTYNGVQQGFIAKAVPEPSSILGVLSLGMFGFGGWLKRKK